MPLKLRQETVDQLTPIVASFLERVTVAGDCIPNFGNGFGIIYDAEDLLPKTGPRKEEILKYIGERSLLKFASSFIDNLLYGRVYDRDARERPLLEVVGADSAQTLATALLEAFQSLPWDYWASVALPKPLADFFAQFGGITEIADGVRVICDADEIERTVPVHRIPTGNGGLFGLLHPTKPTAFLQFRTKGLFVEHNKTETLEDVISLVKAFLGLSIATGLFKVEERVEGFPVQREIYFLLCESEGASGGRQKFTERESIGISRVLPSEKGRKFEHIAPELKAIFSDVAENQKLLRACEWLFNAHVGDDSMLQFVQATVVLEIVLGDKDTSEEIGLGSLLANRCAYMIGKTTTERATILREFKILYGVRSRIVHSGKHRLTDEEHIKLFQLLWIGRRVIQAEVDLVVRDRERIVTRQIAEALSREA